MDMSKYERVDPVESLEYPGFYEIPGYSRYVINMQGEVFDKDMYKYRKMSKRGSTSKFGKYRNCTIKHDNGTMKGHGRHRLLCQVFKLYDVDCTKLQVNHIDGVPGSDGLSNLEWVTSHENTLHAGRIGISPKCLPMETRNVDTGVTKSYRSILECALELGYGKDVVSDRAQSGETCVYADRLQYRITDVHAKEPVPWKVPDDAEQSIEDNTLASRCECKDLHTGVITKFRSQGEMSIGLGRSEPVISEYLTNPKQPIVRIECMFYLLRYTHGDKEFRQIDDVFKTYNEEASSGGSKIVHRYHVESGKSKFFMSAQECADFLNITLGGFQSYRLKTAGSKVFPDGCLYGYYPYDTTKHNKY